MSVFGVAESFLKSDDRPSDLDSQYLWIGKCRKTSKANGGTGLCISQDIVILDENLVNSKSIQMLSRDFGPLLESIILKLLSELYISQMME